MPQDIANIEATPDISMPDTGGVSSEKASDLDDLTAFAETHQPSSGKNVLVDLGDLTTPEPPPSHTAAASAAKAQESQKGTDEFAPIDFEAGQLDPQKPVQKSEPSVLGASQDFDLGPEPNNFESFSAKGLDALDGQSELGADIEDGYDDLSLAQIRKSLLNLPPKLKKAVIDTVVQEKLPQNEQRALMNMLIDGSSAQRISAFIESQLGYPPLAEGSFHTKEGLAVLYTDELTPQAVAQRKRRNRLILASFSIAFVSLFIFLGTYKLRRWFFVQNLYEKGLKELRDLRYISSPIERKKRKEKAESYFQAALKEDQQRYNVTYLNRYGIAYMKARFYDAAFEKLFGKAKPAYGTVKRAGRWNAPDRKIPLIRIKEGFQWQKNLGKGSIFTDQLKVDREVLQAGAYMVDRLRDSKMGNQSLRNLARFHSFHARDFIKKNDPAYKNDALGIAYYRAILSLGKKPRDTDALAGIGDIHYQTGDLTKAIVQYRSILKYFPLNLRAHAALLNCYIALAQTKKDPRPALAKHRELRRLGLEEELPIYILSRLASLYTRLDEDDLLIKHQLNPIDSLQSFDLKKGSLHLLQLAFQKEEERDQEKIIGSKYSPAFYQRGLFLAKNHKRRQALRQFQNAYNYDPMHYLAINAIGEYYREVRDFDRASLYFQKAIKSYQAFMPYAGGRPEDEVLMKGDIGRVYYNLGSLLFLRYAGISSDEKGTHHSPAAMRIYPFRAQKTDSASIRKVRQKLDQARKYFQKALEFKLQDTSSLLALQYWLGWIDYMNGNFPEALITWEKTEELEESHGIAMLMAKANAYYYTNQLRSALGYYNKMKTDLENNLILVNEQQERDRNMLLTSIYNNMGAVYEKEAQSLPSSLESLQKKEWEQNALLYYWKSIESARRANITNEIARANVQLAFKLQGKREPLLDDWLFTTLPIMSQKK